MIENPAWRFRKIRDDQKHVEPTHREHLATGGAVEPLVRESIQNSLDATISGKSTKVIFTLGLASAETGGTYFDELGPHLNAIVQSLPEGLTGASEDFRFLAIEDYNTRGLEGDPALRKPANVDGTKNHFFRFWHSVGQSTGEFKRRGSWGVGKVVFSNASRIRTFFGLTLRSGDGSALLMGEAGLTIHTLAGSDEMYDWYGYYATPRSKAEQDVPLPIREAATVQKFAEVFSLSRTVPGLSILVPYLREGVDLDSLARAAIEQYFLPILSGRLEVVVRDGAREIIISRSSIRDAVAEISWPQRRTEEELFALLDLARWQISLEPDNYVLLDTAGAERQYSLDPVLFPPESLQRMTDDFASGTRVAIRIPIRVRPKQGEAATEEVRVVLERDERLRVRSDVPHLRSGINISKMRETGPAGVRGLLVVGFDSEALQGELDKLLQASEGPAHINWEQRGEGYDKARLLYEDAHKVIGFVRHLVRNLVELLITPADAQDTRTLAVFFPDPEQDGNSNRRKKQPDPKPSPPAGVIEGIVRAISPGLGGLRPVEAAEVVLSQPGTMKTAKTGADGRYRFEGLEPTEYEINPCARIKFRRVSSNSSLEEGWPALD